MEKDPNKIPDPIIRMGLEAIAALLNYRTRKVNEVLKEVESPIRVTRKDMAQFKKEVDAKLKQRKAT